MSKVELMFIGIDYWDRPVFRDPNGKIWKDVNLGYGTPSLRSASGNDFDGEPDMPCHYIEVELKYPKDVELDKFEEV